MPRKPFKPGPDDRRGKGGARPGAGRKPDAFKAKLREIAGSPKALKFLKDAIEGERVDARMVEGAWIWAPASAGTRAQIWESVHDRGFGKPVSLLEMQDQDGNVAPARALLPGQAKKDKRPTGARPPR